MANRTPSPNPTRTQNPNPRTPENSTVMRKTPWVNPNYSKQPISHNSAELPHSNSGSKGGVASASPQASLEQKENRAKSPAVTYSKGTKNFMAPTISAASKVTAASPKKKILMERNEISRSSLTSISSSFEFLASDEAESKLEIGACPQMLSNTPKILKASMNETGSVDSRENLGIHEYCDFRLKNDRSVATPFCSPSSVIAHLDADPTLPPYDPKTNYLSPRPQFLHYRPKPCGEIYPNKEGLFDLRDGKQLDDSFSSESCGEITEQNGETQSSDLEEDFEDHSLSSGLEPQEVEIETHDDNITNFLETPKCRSFPRFKTVSLVLFLVVACLFISVIDTPILSSSSTTIQQPFIKLHVPAIRVLQDRWYPRDSLARITEFAYMGLEELAYKFRSWSINFVVHIPSVVSIPGEDVGLFHATNLTCPALDQRIERESYEKNSHFESSMKIEEGDGEEEETYIEYGKENFEVLLSDDFKEEESNLGHDLENSEMGDPENGKEKDDSLKHGMIIFEMEDLEENSPTEQVTTKSVTLEAMEEDKGNEVNSLEDLPNVEDEVSDELFLSDNNSTVEFEEEKSEVQTDLALVHIQSSTGVGIYSHDFELDEDSRRPHTSETPENSSNGPEGRLPSYAVLGLLSAILAAIVFSLHLKHKRSPTAVDERRVPFKKAVPSSEWGGNESLMHVQSPIYQNYTVEVETLGGSGPSFSSSLQNSSSYHLKRRVKEDEILSHERMLRRDSVASSTSYGSFTTYEKLSGKKILSKGIGDEDVVMTPVRRSSRIKNLVTSP